MKKIPALLLAILLLFACSAMAEIQSVPEMGLELDIPGAEDLTNCTISEIDFDNLLGIKISYYNMSVFEPIGVELQNAMLENDTAKMAAAQAKVIEANTSHMATYYTIVGMEPAEIEAKWEAYGLNDQNTVEIGSNSTRTYFVVTGDPNEALSEEDQALMEESRATADAIVASAKVIEISERETVSAFPAFETVDMNGNTVTEDIFSQADLTVLNVWGTYCAPCIAEMPELAEWANELPEGVQIVGLITDVNSTDDKNFTKAEKIISKSGVSFTNILNNDSLSSFTKSITGTPTTFFIDSTGNSVRDPITGAYFDQYKAAVQEYLGE